MPGMNMLPGGTTLQIPLDAPTGFTAKAGNAQVTLTWTDPKDKYATPEGETAQDPDQLVSVWDHTVLVRKTGSQPAGPNDGTVVVSSSVRDQYASAGYVDDGLTNDTLYYYAAFAYNTDGVASEGAFVNATPIAGTPLAQLAEGTLIKIQENGAPVEFYVAKQDYESELNGTGRILMVRKDSPQNCTWGNGYGVYTYYNNCLIRTWLNDEYLNRFSTVAKQLIGTSGYYAFDDTFQNGYHVSGYYDPIFIPSLTEYGFSYNRNDYQNAIEGTQLPVASTLLSGINNVWTRSVNVTNSQSSFIWAAFSVSSSGGGAMGAQSSYAIQPCFTLPATARVDADLSLIETA